MVSNNGQSHWGDYTATTCDLTFDRQGQIQGKRIGYSEQDIIPKLRQHVHLMILKDSWARRAA